MWCNCKCWNWAGRPVGPETWPGQTSRSIQLFPAGDHGLDLGGQLVPGGGQVQMRNQKRQHQERTHRVGGGHPLQLQRSQAPGRPVGIKQIQPARHPDQRTQQREHRQIRQALQRVVLLPAGGLERVRLMLEDARRVVIHDRQHLVGGRNVLAPLPRGHMPENGKYP